MYIQLVSAECAPIAKAGGLGDFIHGLGRELVACGHDVDVIVPEYDILRYNQISDWRPLHRDLWVPFHGQRIHCDVNTGTVDGLRCLFISAHSEQGFFNRGALYGEPDDVERFAFFCRAVLEYLIHAPRHPDVIHCHDWQTGLIPVLLYELYEQRGLNHTRVCYSLHNLGYQGWTDQRVLELLGLNTERLMTPDRLQDPACTQTVNLMKGGIVFSNFVTTVSPRYAWEVQHTEQGMGLQNLLLRYDHKFGGILNGIDYLTWDPATDPLLTHHYTPDTLKNKAANQTALRRRFGLTAAKQPIMAVVSRLDRQKGIELIEHGINYALANKCQFVLLGSALEPDIHAHFQSLQQAFADHPHCHLELTYNEELAHLIYAGADMMLIPSLYEPCGLTQMIAMRYGCVPIVRQVGGLADTVFDANYSDRTFEECNGYVFTDPTSASLESALQRAIGLWYDHPDYFRQLRLNGMKTNHSWANPAQRYLEIYHFLTTRSS
jgi:starch synthase